MSDTEKQTPNKTAASGATWSDGEKIAYLLVLCENEGKIDAKIAAAPVPHGRTAVSCKKLLFRLKEKHKDDILNIKANKPLGAVAVGAEPAKPKTPRKRKSKADEGSEESPMKKAGGRKKNELVVKEEIKEEVTEEEGADEDVHDRKEGTARS